MKKRLLIIIEALGSGGAEKSLISLLRAFEEYQSKIEIDLLVFKPYGMYYDQIPSYCRVIDTPKESIMMCHGLGSKYFWKYFTVRGFVGKILHLLKKTIKGEGELGPSQYVWNNWEKYIPRMKEHFDVAMSYFQGYSNYFAVTKCNAPKRYVFIHHEYQKLNVNLDFDRRYFEKASGIFTVSDRCVDSVTEVFPEFKEKTFAIGNILDPKLIETMSREYVPEEFSGLDSDTVKITSIGRLSPVKRFDRAIEAAAVLRKSGINFVWTIVGEGELEDDLNKKIKQLGLENNVFLSGVKSNPYPYIGGADIFVQTSDNEGRSLVIDEAKILLRPIVVTRYKTAADVIENEKTGLLCDFSAESVADSIIRLCRDASLRQKLSQTLSSFDFDNKSETEKYFHIWDI